MRLSLSRIGWHPKAYYASVGPALQEFYDRLKKDADLAFSSSQWEPRARFPNSERFYREFVKEYHKPPSYHAAAAYAAGEMLESAIKKAESMDRNKIREALLSMDAMTIIGRYGVNMAGIQIRHIN